MSTVIGIGNTVYHTSNAGRAAGLLLHDDFTDTDAVEIVNHTPTPIDPGNPWTQTANNIEILNDQAWVDTTAVASTSTIDCGAETNYAIATFETSTSNGTLFLRIRYIDENNLWEARLTDSTLQVREETLGVNTTRGSTNVTTAKSVSPQTISITHTGSIITATSETDSVTTDPPFESTEHAGATKIALRHIGASEHTIDDLKVSS